MQKFLYLNKEKQNEESFDSQWQKKTRKNVNKKQTEFQNLELQELLPLIDATLENGKAKQCCTREENDKKLRKT